MKGFGDTMALLTARTTKRRTNRIRRSLAESFGVSAISIGLVLISILFLIPFWYVLSTSLSSEYALANFGVRLIPREFSLAAYRFMMTYSHDLVQAYFNTVLIAGATTGGMLLITSLFAYPLSKKDFPGRTGIMMYVLFSMLVGGGLVPYYLAINWYGFNGSWLALIIPGSFSAWNMILMRNYFSSLPAELEESAFMDGAGYFTILFRIVLPLSKPILATLSLFCIIGCWNNWYSALLFLSKSRDLWPIMMFLKVVLESVNPATTWGMPAGGSFPPQESLKMATIILCIAPVLITYPFMQKYFVKGIMIGSIKG